MEDARLIWPLTIALLGIIVAVAFGFDIAKLATKTARMPDPIWPKAPRPWSDVTRPSYWRVVGVEIGVFLIGVGVVVYFVINSR